jgi:hypothetical protein
MNSDANTVGVEGLRADIEALREQTKADIAALEEKSKEREPSLLGAIRTLAADYQQWMQGERDFPKSAVVGAAFAYLRPRIVLMLGSLAAVLVAALQIVMLWRQNALIEQQNSLIEQQGRALAAQTTVSLLTGLEKDNVPRTTLSVLATFGDIGLDSLLTLAREPEDPSGGAAQRALSMASARFTNAQRGAVIRAFIEGYAEEMRRDTLIELAHAVGPQTAISELEMRQRGTLHQLTMQNSLAELFRSLKLQSFRISELNTEQRLALMGDIGRMYVMSFTMYDLNIESLSSTAADPLPFGGFLWLDGDLQGVCNGPHGTASAKGDPTLRVIARAILTLRDKHGKLPIGSVVAVAVKRACDATGDVSEHMLASRILGSAATVSTQDIETIGSVFSR